MIPILLPLQMLSAPLSTDLTSLLPAQEGAQGPALSLLGKIDQHPFEMLFKRPVVSQKMGKPAIVKAVVVKPDMVFPVQLPPIDIRSEHTELPPNETRPITATVDIPNVEMIVGEPAKKIDLPNTIPPQILPLGVPDIVTALQPTTPNPRDPPSLPVSTRSALPVPLAATVEASQEVEVPVEFITEPRPLAPIAFIPHPNLQLPLNLQFVPAENQHVPENPMKPRKNSQKVLHAPKLTQATPPPVPSNTVLETSAESRPAEQISVPPAIVSITRVSSDQRPILPFKSPLEPVENAKVHQTYEAPVKLTAPAVKPEAKPITNNVLSNLRYPELVVPNPDKPAERPIQIPLIQEAIKPQSNPVQVANSPVKTASDFPPLPSHPIQQNETAPTQKVAFPTSKNTITESAPKPLMPNISDTQISVDPVSDTKPVLLPVERLESSTMATQASPSATLQKHVAVQITQALKIAPDQPIEIALDPVELGKVRIVLNTNETNIMVQITAERPETAEMMRRHLAQLETEFKGIGYDDVGFEFTQNNKSDPEHPEFTSQNGDTSQPNENVNAAQTTNPTVIRLDGQTGLDIRL